MLSLFDIKYLNMIQNLIFGIDLESFRKNNGFSRKNEFMIKQFAAEEFFKNKKFFFKGKNFRSLFRSFFVETQQQQGV